jgi:SnoaL-like domain
MLRGLKTVVVLAVVAVGPAAAAGDQARADKAADEALARVVADYVGLYRRDTLDRWRELFLPTFSVASTKPDGSLNLRNLDEFFEAQKRYLDSGRAIREELENVRTERQGRLASVWADFVLTDEGEKSRGRLVLLLIEEKGRFRIHSLLFSYE